MDPMSLLLYIVFGIVAGFIANKLVGGGGGLVMNLIVGIIGSVLGGWLFSRFLGVTAAPGFNLQSLLVAVAGGVVLLLIVNLIRRR